MSHRLSVALGDRRSVALARSPLADAIHAGLHGVPKPRIAGRRAGPLLASALALSLAPALAQSAVITVDSELGIATADGLCQLPEAVANANGGAVEADCEAGDAGLDSIVFDPSLVESTISLVAPLAVTEPLEIDGAAAPGLLIAGTGGHRLINAGSDLAVSNLALAGGDAGSEDGGAIAGTDALSALTVDNVDFLGNYAKYGGAIDAAGPLTVTDSYFADNEAEGKYLNGIAQVGSGGAISSSQRPTITGSAFFDNVANGGGGAVSSPLGATITDSIFERNQARVGGAVLSGNASELLASVQQQPQGVPPSDSVVLEITDSTFRDNVAYRLDETSEYAGPAVGGAVLFIPRNSVDGSVAHALTITGSEFTGNGAVSGAGGNLGNKYSTGGAGGALAAMLPAEDNQPRDQAAVTIDDSLFEENLAAFGGAALVSTSSITIDDSTFSDNRALIAGAASLGMKYGKYQQGSSLVLSGTTFSDNAAYLIGGAALFGATVQADALSVTGNVAGGPSGDPYAPEFDCGTGRGKYGGAVIYADTATLTGANLVDGNCAGLGGGLGVNAQSGSIAPGTVVSNNQALADDGIGGGLLVRSGAMLIDGLTISGNSSSTTAGGLFAYGTITLANSTVSGNAAGTGGGIYAGVPGSQPVQAKGSLAQQLTLLNTTIHDNTATAPPIVAKGTWEPVPGTGGGIAIGADFQLDARFATITDNGASGAGGGIWLDPAATASLSDSIVAGNTAPTGPDIAGTLAAQYTLVQDPAGATFTGAGTGNQTGLAPELGPLQDNGGLTATRVPLPGSPVIDSGDPGFATPPEFDQRGPGFPRVVNGVVDKGAVEAALPVPQLISLAIDPATVVEGNSASIIAGLDVIAPSDVYVTLDLAGQATAGLDYTIADADPLTSGVQLLVAAGDSEGSIALQALADGISEPDESVTATVATVAGADLPAPLSATGTIVDSDGLPMVTLSLDQASIVEEGGSTTLTVTLSMPSSQDVTITLGFSGTATFGSDYTVTATQIVIPAGQTSGSVVLSTIDDAEDEGDETVVVDILSVTNAQESGTQQGVIVIDDTADGGAVAPAPAPYPQPAIIPTLSEWMLMLLGLLLPATVVARLRRAEAPSRRR